MGRILGLVNGVWATAQERKMHAIRQRFNLYAGGSLSADVRRFFQLISADEVLGTHRHQPRAIRYTLSRWPHASDFRSALHSTGGPPLRRSGKASARNCVPGRTAVPGG